MKIGSLSKNDGNGYENVTYKVNLHYFKIYYAYSNSFSSSNVGKPFWSWILKDSIKVQEKKKKVLMCSHLPQNMKFGTFMFKSGSDSKEMYKKA